MKIFNKKNLIVSILIIISFFLGFFVKSPNSFTLKSEANNTQDFIDSLNKGNDDATKRADLTLFWKTWNTLNTKFIDSGKLDTEKRMYGAIQGMVNASGDPYTMFFPPQEAKMFADSIKGEFGGIGAEIGTKDKILTVIAPLKDSPSFKAGLKSGDKIIKINDKTTEGLNTDEAVSQIRGKKGTVVKLTIYREGDTETRDFNITRDTITVPTLDTKKIQDKKIFVISLYSFNEKSADLFTKAIAEYKQTGYKNLIIDLRQNPGGYLESAVDMANWFLDDGKTIVYEDFGKDKGKEYHRATKRDGIVTGSKVFILADGGSASASEILAGALKDNNIAKVVGQKTFGKGSVQELLDMGNGSTLKVTIAKWFTPSGVSISEKGIIPDVEIKISEEEKEIMSKDPKRDIALEKTIELFK